MHQSFLTMAPNYQIGEGNSESYALESVRRAKCLNRAFHIIFILCRWVFGVSNGYK